MQTPVLEPAPLERDKDGYYIHPLFQEYWTQKFGNAEGCTSEEMKTLKSELGIITCTIDMELDISVDDPLRKSFFEDGGNDISTWIPSSPQGEGWFILSINDTDDGPVAMWAKKVSSDHGNN